MQLQRKLCCPASLTLGIFSGVGLVIAVLAFTQVGPQLVAPAALQEALAELPNAGLVQRPLAKNPQLWLGIGAVIAVIGVGIARGNRVALILAMLFGVPLDVPFRRLGNEAKAIQRQARWLAHFLRERPRSHNTAGAHLACGAIAVKKALKALALRRERADRGLVELQRLRKRLVRTRARASRGVYRCLIAGLPEAVEQSRTEYRCTQTIASIDQELLERRLELQAPIVEGFQRAWQEMHQAGLVSDTLYAQARVEFQQPEGEPEALLPNGLVRSTAGFLFEYGTFLGRIGLAVAFVATFQVTFLFWALVLLALDLYVVEPVVLKLQMSSMALLLDGPGHKLTDLAQYLEALPEDAVFRFPITIPKFSSNPARANINAIIAGALEKCRLSGCELRSFAMRDRHKRVVLELPDAPAPALAEQAKMLCDALRAALEQGRATFPLATEVSAQGRQITIALLDDDQTIWDMIGEDASQAFVYLRRNLHALCDTLSYLGAKFQPVFILASNTEDPDAIEYELAELAKLQAWSDREYAGQVGFLYLLRGGQWYDYNASLERFDAKDKSFVVACADFKAKLLDPKLPAREALLAALLRTAQPQRSVQGPSPAREALLAELIRSAKPEQLASMFNSVLLDEHFYRHFEGFSFDELPDLFHPTAETLALLERQRAAQALSKREMVTLNRELLLTLLPIRVRGAFFKKVGNDIAVEELLVTGKTRPTTYTDRRFQEHVQDPACPNYLRVWGDFARYTGLAGDNHQIQERILGGEDLVVQSIPEISATLDDKNELAPGEIEKALATMLHSENRHVVIGVPRIRVTLPEHKGATIASDYILAARGARDTHNENEGLTRSRLFSFASPAYGKWFKRPKPYYAHYAYGALNAAHALSHDFQQSYLVAGAGGRLSGFTEALYGPRHFEVLAAPEPAFGLPAPARARHVEVPGKRPLRASFEWVHTSLLGALRPWRQSRER